LYPPDVFLPAVLKTVGTLIVTETRQKASADFTFCAVFVQKPRDPGDLMGRLLP
jgi:hypothetical protein